MGGKILAVGSNDSVLQLAGPATKQIDLAGKTIMLGFINTHIHPHRDAIIHYTDLLPPEYRKYYRASGMIFEWEDKKLVLEQIKRIIAKVDSDVEWIIISGRPMIGGGSLGPKEADLLVLDRNPLDSALLDDQLATIKILMTMVGGKVKYKATDFLPL